jgi:hypothetical protein
LLLADALTHLEPIHSGHRQVEQDHIECFLLDPHQALRTIERVHDLDPVLTEILRE